MAQTVIMPKLGQTVEESTIVKWHKKTGDTVKKGDILFEIETDKAVLEIESFFDGTLLKIIVQEGETVPVLTPVGFIGKPGEAIPEVVAPPQKAAASESARTVPAIPPGAKAEPRKPAQPVPSAARAPEPVQSAVQPPRKRISPRAQALIKQCGIGAGPIAGTGPDGRIVEKDVKAYLEAKGYYRLKISPAARELAVKNGIDLLGVESPGDKKRIQVDDVQRAIDEKPKEMSKIRQIIAQRLTQSVLTAPHFFVTTSVDMTDLLALRKEMKRENKPYSVTDFLLKSVALTLTEFPAVNSSTDGKTVRWHSRVHLGMAVDVKEGLVVPVIRNANELTLADLHQRVLDLATRARDGKLRPDEMSGGTFTVSNMGMLNVENFTAIINPGESAILAVSSISPSAVVVKDAVVVRSVMKMTVSSDHRIVDGAMAARFVNSVKNKLEDMNLWKSMMS